MKRAHTLELLKRGPVDLAGRKADTVPARGYSQLELKRAGLSEEQARVLGLPLDLKRRTGIGANVMRLRELV